ncbi:hypothetical protein K431DRAFT_245067 [Polychaeton citri CBS 116435]|uniref:MHYT domain-containing protein n=1 Tax=Polychaeton citri CBS 116435 TaxID=1314669 RepID=A0A9P4UR77_9PEZI|nr:hypothetical protein K431DRAFT_245067 [Polychaeton citri CBS 116435]
MGLIGIWCMHFIGNRAISMHEGESELQLVYNAGFNTLSVFLPVIGLTIAFSTAEFQAHSPLLHWALLACTGIFAGLSIVGMHYMGNFGITNYTIEYGPQYLIASVLIAIGDCLGVLVIFYTWREKWINSWWKRLLCASLLSGGVTSMHFTASTGCIYKLKHFTNRGSLMARNIQVIVAGALCGTAALTVFGVLFFTQYRARILKGRSQKVMLACAIFDPQGRIMVTTEGVLPAREITNRYHHCSFNEEFDTQHPVFEWIFRVTRNWDGVNDLIPRMKSHLGALRDESSEDSRPTSSASSAVYDPETYSDYSIIFRERFCTAAASLATAMGLPLDRLGVLYDKIVDTGTLPTERSSRRNAVADNKMDDDVEAALQPGVFGQGQLLFLVRQLTYEEADKLLNAGFRFSSTQHVGRNIAGTMQIPLSTFEAHAGGLKRFVDSHERQQKTGTYLTMFTLIGKPNNRGFDVAVKRTDESQLPDAQLFPYWPEPWQMEFLKRLDGHKLSSCVMYLEEKLSNIDHCDPGEGHLASSLLLAIRRLCQQVPESWCRDARFLAKPLYAHYAQNARGRSVPVMLYSFITVADLHSSTTDNSASVTRIPLSFFAVRQRCYIGSPDHMVLAREIHQEFGPLLARRFVLPRPTRSKRYSHLRKITTGGPSSSARSTSSDGYDESDGIELTHSDDLAGKKSSGTAISGTTTVTVREDRGRRRSSALAHTRSNGSSSNNSRDNILGGILVNSETVIRTTDRDDAKLNSSTDLCIGGVSGGAGVKVACGTAKAEETFVDELMAATRARFMPKSAAYSHY